MDQQTAINALNFFNRATHHVDGREIPALVAVLNALHVAAYTATPSPQNQTPAIQPEPAEAITGD